MTDLKSACGGSHLLLGLPKLPSQLANRASFLVVLHDDLDLGTRKDILGQEMLLLLRAVKKTGSLCY